MKAYSIDLRQKIIDVRQAENLSIRALAQRFQVSKNFIENLLQLYRETGTVQPRPRGGGARPKLNAEQLEQLAMLVESQNDATLGELREMLHQETGVSLSITTIHRQLKKMGYSLKKNTLSRKKSHTQGTTAKSGILGTSPRGSRRKSDCAG